jgi:hypothetical protein
MVSSKPLLGSMGWASWHDAKNCGSTDPHPQGALARVHLPALRVRIVTNIDIPAIGRTSLTRHAIAQQLPKDSASVAPPEAAANPMMRWGLVEFSAAEPSIFRGRQAQFSVGFGYPSLFSQVPVL